jgi:hypothetical protein
MSWILADGHSNAIATTRSITLLLELCLDEKKPPLLQIPKSSSDPPTIAISFENRISLRILHTQTTHFIHAFSIECP